MINEKINYPKTIEDCLKPTNSVRKLIVISKILKVSKKVFLIVSAIQYFILAISLSVIFDAFWIFLVTILGGSFLTGIGYLLIVLMKIFLDSRISLIQSNNVNAMLKYMS